MKKALLIVMIAIASVIGLSANASADLEDWGVVPGSQWVPTTSGVSYGISPGQQDPGYGGHPYDAEAMYLYRDSNKAYISLVAGIKQDGWPDATASPEKNIYPGDFAINLGGAWVKGAPALDYQFGIRTSSNGGSGGLGGIPGNIYTNIEWGRTYEWNGVHWGSQNNPTVIKSGDLVGQAEFDYHLVNGADNLTHYIYEAAIPLNTPGMDFSSGGSVHWTMTCGNDGINVNFPKGIPMVPEPVSSGLFLIGSGALGLAARRKRKLSK